MGKTDDMRISEEWSFTLCFLSPPRIETLKVTWRMTFLKLSYAFCLSNLALLLLSISPLVAVGWAASLPQCVSSSITVRWVHRPFPTLLSESRDLELVRLTSARVALGVKLLKCVQATKWKCTQPEKQRVVNRDSFQPSKELRVGFGWCSKPSPSTHLSLSSFLQNK